MAAMDRRPSGWSKNCGRHRHEDRREKAHSLARRGLYLSISVGGLHNPRRDLARALRLLRGTLGGVHLEKRPAVPEQINRAWKSNLKEATAAHGKPHDSEKADEQETIGGPGLADRGTIALGRAVILR